MESFNINLTQQRLDLINSPDVDVAAFFDMLFAPHSSNYRQLAFELQREFRQGGSPDVVRIAFDRVTYDAATGKGGFRVVLDIRFTFGCEDSVTEKTNQTSEWTFNLNHTDASVSFYSSPFAEARSTADEF